MVVTANCLLPQRAQRSVDTGVRESEMKEIKLGCRAEDTVTGLKGIVIARAEYLNGCIQYCLKPRIDSTKTTYPEGEWIDEIQVKRIGDGVLANPKKKPAVRKKPKAVRTASGRIRLGGGPQRDAPKM